MIVMNTAPFTMLDLSNSIETATRQNGQTAMEEQPHTFSINPMDFSFSFNLLKLLFKYTILQTMDIFL